MRRKGTWAVALATAVTLSTAGIAHADNLHNNVVVNGNDTITIGSATTIDYRISATANDGQQGCNASDGSAAVVSIVVPAGVTASPSTLTFRDCGPQAAQGVTFSSSSAGSFAISSTVSDPGIGTYNTAQANWTLRVNPVAVPADTTPPALTVPSDITTEAMSAAGAVVSYVASALDAVDGAVTPTCAPASGSTFPLGATEVMCSATDKAGNSASASFTATVRDTTAPELTGVPTELMAEATDANGARVTYTAPAATDAVDPEPVVACTPASGAVFSLGTTSVSCSATDQTGNTSTRSFSVTVTDTTGPLISLPTSATEEATGPNGAVVTYAAVGNDLVDGAVSVTCDPTSGSTFALGQTTVGCSATDAAGNTTAGTFVVKVQDTTAPTLKVPADITNEATSAAGAIATFTASATDLVDGNVPVECSADSGSTFALGTATITCTATDAAGNDATGVFTVKVQDTTAPTLTVPANITNEATSSAGGSATWTASATDLVDGDVPVKCSADSGSTFALGTTTVTCTATDAAGNDATGVFTVKVQYSATKILQPINADGSSSFKLNSTIPVKIKLAGASVGINDAVITQSVSKLSNSVWGEEVEAASTAAPHSGSTLRYDATSDQYIYNLATKPLGAGTFRVTLNLGGGKTETVQFSIVK